MHDTRLYSCVTDRFSVPEARSLENTSHPRSRRIPPLPRLLLVPFAPLHRLRQLPRRPRPPLPRTPRIPMKMKSKSPASPEGLPKLVPHARLELVPPGRPKIAHRFIG